VALIPPTVRDAVHARVARTRAPCIEDALPANRRASLHRAALAWEKDRPNPDLAHLAHHVSAILRKLDVRTRGEAGAAATRLGLTRD
jgi:hypothetical protein